MIRILILWQSFNKTTTKLQLQRGIHDIIFLACYFCKFIFKYSSSGNEGKYGVKGKQSRTVEQLLNGSLVPWLPIVGNPRVILIDSLFHLWRESLRTQTDAGSLTKGSIPCDAEHIRAREPVMALSKFLLDNFYTTTDSTKGLFWVFIIIFHINFYLLRFSWANVDKKMVKVSLDVI